MDKEILLLVNHGSRLYGLHHADSDYDTFKVLSTPPVANRFGAVRKKNGTHVVAGANDDTVFDYKTFLIHVYNGVPQALEAMFAKDAIIDRIPSYRKSYHASVGVMANSYTRQIENFAHGTMKRRRHALRYALNLREAVERGGRFSPELSQDNIDFVKEAASSERYVAELRKVSVFEINVDEVLIRENIAADKEES